MSEFLLCYSVFSYLFMAGFCQYSYQQKAMTWLNGLCAWLISPFTLPIFIGGAFAGWMDSID